MKEHTICPNCNQSIKKGTFSSNEIVSKKIIDQINYLEENTKDAYCSKCAPSLQKYSLKKITLNYQNISKSINSYLKYIPVITTHSPLNWDYRAIQMVSGQSSTGTGVITEFTSSFTDTFGGDSGRHNKKLRAGEDLCLLQLRKQTLALGGNAIIACDIDYSEIGSGKGILMVCMAGTAIELKNTDIISNNLSIKLEKLNELSKEKLELKNLL